MPIQFHQFQLYLFFSFFYPYYILVLDFDILMDEAKMLWGKVIQRDKNPEAQEILKNIFGKPTKFSEILPEDVEKLNQAIIEIKDIL